MCKTLNIRLIRRRFWRICAAIPWVRTINRLATSIRPSLMPSWLFAEASLAILRITKAWRSPCRAASLPIARGRGRSTLQHLSRQTMGDRDLERDVLGLFAEQAQTVRKQIGKRRDQAAALPGARPERFGARRRRFRDRRMRLRHRKQPDRPPGREASRPPDRRGLRLHRLDQPIAAKPGLPEMRRMAALPCAQLTRAAESLSREANSRDFQ